MWQLGWTCWCHYRQTSTQTLSYEFTGREVRTFIPCEGEEFVMYTRVGKWKDSSADATGTALGFDVTEGSMSIHQVSP